MRKNNGVAKKLGIYAHYEVKGLNQDYLISLLGRKGIGLYNVKKISNKKMRFSVKVNQVEKFFAIIDNLCYNIKRIRLHGKTMPFYLALRNFGVVLGTIIFFVFSAVCNGYLYEVEFIGNGKILEREVTSFLEENGVKKYSKFSDIDLSEISDKILASNPNLTFASCEKHGNKLVVELVLSENASKSTIGAETQIVSDVKGVIEDIKVYRGTPVKNVGDTVDVGELIVDGTATVKEEIIKVNPIAYVSVLTESKLEYFSKEERAEEIFSATAESENSDKDVVSTSVEKESCDGGYRYIVTIKYRHVIYK